MGISISSLVSDLQPFAHDLVDLAGANGLQPRITSARRSYEEQRRLYDRFVRGLQPFPVAPPGTSAHETGEAFDLLVTPVEYLADLGKIWIDAGGEWGGNKDPVHFQLPGAPTPALLAETRGGKASLWSVGFDALSFTSLPSALIELIYTAASEKEAVSLIRDWNRIFGTNIDPYAKIF